MKTHPNLEELESMLKQFAQNASLGATEEWDDLVYEWLGQSLTVGYDRSKNEFYLTLVLAGARIEWPYDVLNSIPLDSLGEVLSYMVEECSEKILDYGAEMVRINIRNALGC